MSGKEAKPKGGTGTPPVCQAAPFRGCASGCPVPPTLPYPRALPEALPPACPITLVKASSRDQLLLQAHEGSAQRVRKAGQGGATVASAARRDRQRSGSRRSSRQRMRATSPHSAGGRAGSEVKQDDSCRSLTQGNQGSMQTVPVTVAASTPRADARCLCIPGSMHTHSSSQPGPEAPPPQQQQPARTSGATTTSCATTTTTTTGVHT